MLSAMTTSENFPPSDRSGCSRSPYETAIRATTHVGGFPLEIGQAAREGENIGIGRRLLRGSSHRSPPCLTSPLRCLPGRPGGAGLAGASDEAYRDGRREGNESFGREMTGSKPGGESSDSLEQQQQPEMEDSSPFDQSRPLKIDPNVLKLDFSKLSSQLKRACSLDECLRDSFEMKRTSHHLSGGGLLLLNANESRSPSKVCGKSLEVGSSTRSEKMFDFENAGNSDDGMSQSSRFSNRISPSSPLSFDSTVKKHPGKAAATDGISFETESTNPFKNFSRSGSCVEEESFFRHMTNPFANNSESSSLKENASITLASAEYENISSFSGCPPTGSASPASIPDWPDEHFAASNPFLIDDAGSEPGGSAARSQFPLSESKLSNPAHSLANNNCSSSSSTGSFILAVPVFSIFQHGITDSSTQTTDASEAPYQEPVYQNVSSRLSKFMLRNEHSEYDFQCLTSTMKDLRNSGWYYENVSWQESVALLANTEPGTFLVRDSSDPDFLFSLSVQTSRGPTSVRIHYVKGQFRLDAEKKLIPHMPSFNSVIELVDYYVENTVKNESEPRAKSLKNASRHKLQKSKDQVWIDAQGNIYSNILLVKPLRKKDHFSTLQHLARLAINRRIRKRLNAKVKFKFRVTPVYESSPFQDSSFQNNFDNFCPILNIDALPLSPKLLRYLKEYPFCH